MWLFVAGGLLVLAVRALPSAGPRTQTAGLVVTVAAAAPTGKVWGVLFFFAKAGMFVFGSGLAIVPFLHGGVVQGYHWLTERQFVDAVAVAMITPGPVVITVAFIGYLVAGLRGALAAAAGVFFHVYLIVLLLGPHFRRLAKNPQVRAFVLGVTAAAVGAIAGAVVVIARRSVHDPVGAGIALVTLIALWKWKIPEPIVILLAGLAGLLLYPG